MKNPFKRKKAADPPAPIPKAEPEVTQAAEETKEEQPSPQPAPPKDDFIEWRRSQTRGGVERRDRNDFYEEYSVYGTDSGGHLICRRYHRYPEHEREFGLSYSRELDFGDFNRRLLAELDKGGIKLDDYRFCIEKAIEIARPDADPASADDNLTEVESAALQAFCDSLDIFKDQSYLHSEGVLRCECESVVGSEQLNLWFRKPLRYDALDYDVAGVGKESVNGYDIEDLWIMGVYNRVKERCSSCAITLLTSEWSLNKESLYLFRVEGFSDVNGDLLIAVGGSSQFYHFGFYLLDFSA